MATIIVLCGLPASGKSTYAENILIEYYDALYLSSDNMRIHLFNNVHDQTHNKQLFQEMHRRATLALLNEMNVVYDATNLSIKDRKRLLQILPHCTKICYFFNTPLEECIQRDAMRDRHVGQSVITKMLNRLEPPSCDEGWDLLVTINEENKDV